MMKMEITSAKAHVTGRFSREGSVLAQTIQAHGDGVEVRLEVESPEEPAKVAGVLRNAEKGCFVMQALAQPTPVSSSVLLNGEEIDVEALAGAGAG
jgi:uncharacterized OsmC-like protein